MSVERESVGRGRLGRPNSHIYQEGITPSVVAIEALHAEG